jgi:hypothetical protein
MRNLLRFAVLMSFMSVMPGVRAADVSGTWKGTFEFEGTAVPVTLHMVESGAVITGTVEGLPPATAEIHDGKVEGDTISFWVNTEYQGSTYKLVYKGKITAGEIDFSFGTDDGSWSSTMTAKSDAQPAAPSIGGNWNGSFNFEGSDVPLILHLTAVADTLTGTVEGLPTTPAEIHEGKIIGDTVSFWVNTDYQGTTYRLVWKGKISSGKIEFTLGTDDGSWGTGLTAARAS